MCCKGEIKAGILFALLLGYAHLAVAQSPLYPHYTIRDFQSTATLPQNSIANIEMDKNGYAWLSTQFGMVRFDGRKFYSFNTFNEPKFRSNRIYWLGADYEGDVYVEDERRKHPLRIVNSSNFEVMDTGKDGVIYICAAGKKSSLFRFYPRQGSYTYDQLVASFHTDDAGFKSLYVINEKQAYVYYQDLQHKGHLAFLDDGTIKTCAVPAGIAFTSGFVLDGHLVFITEGGKCFVMRGSDAFAIKDMAGDLAVAGIFEKTVNVADLKISANRSGTFVIWERNIYELKYSDGQVLSRLLFADGAFESIEVLYYNRKEQVYLAGSLTEGFKEIIPSPFTIKQSHRSRDEENNFYAQLLLPGDRILTTREAVFSHDSVTYMPQPRGLRHVSMFRDAQKGIWYSADALMRADSNFKDPVNMLERNEDAVSYIQVAPDTLWVAFRHSLCRFTGDMNAPAMVSSPVLDTSTMECMIRKSGDTFLVGTRNGLLYFDTRKMQFIPVVHSNDLSVRNIHRCRDGYTWVGTYGNGYYLLDEQEKKLLLMPMDRNKFLINVHCIVEDEQGYFWLSTNNGLFQVLKKDLLDFASGKRKKVFYAYYNQWNGFKTNEFNGGCFLCAATMSDGTVSLPSLKGLVWFKPREMQPVLPTGRIYIDRVEVDDKKMPADAAIEVKARFNLMKVSVSTPYFGSQNNVNIEYRLTGLNENWSEVDDDGIISFNTLPGGSYMLELRKMTGFGKADYEYMQLGFTVLPRFHETLWFKLLILLLVVLSIYLFIKIRYSLLYRAKQSLEKEVAFRTAQQQALIKELEQSLEELKRSQEELYQAVQQNERLSSVIVHDMKSPLKFLDKTVGYLYKHMDRLSEKEVKEMARELRKSIHELYAFTESFMLWISTQRERFSITPEPVDVSAVIEEIKEFYFEICRFRNNTIQVSYRHTTPTVTDANLVRIIVRNLVDNANKHTENGTISIQTENEDSDLVIIVSDNGNGMETEKLKKLLEEIAIEIKNNTSTYRHFGLRIVHDLVYLLGGDIGIQSTPGKGTRVRLVFRPYTAL